MTTLFKLAVRSKVNLIIGLVSGTGGGKTMSAMRMAQGIVGRDKSFAVIDTEKGRASHYAPPPGQEPNFVTTFRFDVAELNAPFRPDAYADAIEAADKAGYGVIVIDSASHVWAGDGGVLDWQEEELDRMAGDDWKKREAVKMAAWIKPKTSHKHMVQKMLQVRAHLILCFRAEQKIEMVREGGKTVIREKQSLTGLDGWIPISEKSLPFELTASFLMTADAPGIPKPIKLQEQHRALFPLDKTISEESGNRLAEWAIGGKMPEVEPTGLMPEDKIVSQCADMTAQTDIDVLRKRLSEAVKGCKAAGAHDAARRITEAAVARSEILKAPTKKLNADFDEVKFAARLHACSDREVLALIADEIRDIQNVDMQDRLREIYLQRDHELTE